jgi:hypothetical protein
LFDSWFVGFYFCHFWIMPIWWQWSNQY